MESAQNVECRNGMPGYLVLPRESGKAPGQLLVQGMVLADPRGRRFALAYLDCPHEVTNGPLGPDRRQSARGRVRL